MATPEPPTRSNRLDDVRAFPRDRFVWTREPAAYAAGVFAAVSDLESIPADGRYLDEVVDGTKPFHPCFDIDAPAGMDVSDVVDCAITAVMRAVPELAGVGDELAFEQVRLGMRKTEQSDATKTSVHLVFPAYTVASHLHMRVIAWAADEAADSEGCGRVIDTAVYKSTFNLRTYGSAKLVNGRAVRHKLAAAGGRVRDYLVQPPRITGAPLSVRIPAPADEDGERDELDLPAALMVKIAAAFPGTYVYREAGAFDRAAPRDCPTCGRIHEGDGAHVLHDATTGVYSLVCRRARPGAKALLTWRDPSVAVAFAEPVATPAAGFDEAYTERYCRELGLGDVALRGAWGSGKTYQYLRHVRGRPDALMVSMRRSLTAGVCARGDFTSYLSFKGPHDRAKHPKVACQYESLHRLYGDTTPVFDTVVLDEPVGLQAQVFSSCSPDGKNWNVLERIVRACRQVVATDNDLTPEAVAWLKALRPDLRVVNNAFLVDEGKRLTMVPATGRDRGLSDIVNHVCYWATQRAAGDKCTVAVSLKKAAERVAALLTGNGLRVLITTGDTPKRDKERIFRDPVAAMEEYDAFVYTSTASRGVDITDPRFTVAFGLFNSFVSTAEEAAQMAHRARDARQYIVAYASPALREQTTAAVVDLVRENRGRMTRYTVSGSELGLVPLMDMTAVPDIEAVLASPLGLMYINEAALRINSKLNARARFVDIMARCGCVVEDSGDVVAALKNAVPITPDRAAGMAAAVDLTEEDVRRAEADTEISPEMEVAVARYWVLRTYGVHGKAFTGEFAPTAGWFDTFGKPHTQAAYRASRDWSRWAAAAGTQDPAQVIRSPAAAYLAGPHVRMGSLAITSQFDRHSYAQRLMRAAGFVLGSTAVLQKADVLARLATPESGALCLEVLAGAQHTYGDAVNVPRLRKSIGTPVGRLNLVRAVANAQYGAAVGQADNTTRLGRLALVVSGPWGGETCIPLP